MAKEMVELKSSFGWIELQNFEAEPTDTLYSRRGIAAVDDKLMFFDGADWEEVAGGGGGLVENSIENKHIKSSAAIAASKLNLVGAIDNADIADDADIELSKIDGILADEDNGRISGVPYTFVVEVDNSSGGANSVNVFSGDNKPPHKILITDVSVLSLGGDDAATAEVTLNDDSDAVTNGITVGVDKTLTRAATIDSTHSEIAADNDKLKVLTNDKKFTAKVVVTALLVKEAA